MLKKLISCSNFCSQIENYQPEVPTNNSAGLYLDLTLIQKSFQESKNATHMWQYEHIMLPTKLKDIHDM